MKKFFAIFLALILAAAVIVGCGETGVSNPTPDGEVSELYEQVMSRFTGELEKGAVVKVLENDTAIEIGYVDKLIEAFKDCTVRGVTISAQGFYGPQGRIVRLPLAMPDML